MAAASGRKLQKTIIECNLQFDGLVQSSVRARLTAEVLKYLFHQRGQIPLSYEQVKRDVEAGETAQIEDNETRTRRKPQSLHDRRRKLAIATLDSIMKTLDDIFNSGHPIKEVLFIFGSTIMSPKEVYRLRFPVKCYDGKVLNWTTCRMALFQKLVSADVFGDSKPMKPGTKLSVLVLSPRDSTMGELGLIIKPMFKLTHRGSHYAFNFDFLGRVINADLSCAADASFDISGVEMLDTESPILDAHSTPLPSRPNSGTPLSSHSRTRRGVMPGSFPGLRSRKYSRLCSVEESPIKGDSSANMSDFNDVVMDTKADMTTDSDVAMVGKPVITLEIKSSVAMETVSGTSNQGQAEDDKNDSIHDIAMRTEALSLSASNQTTPQIPCVNVSQADFVWFQFPMTVTGYMDKKSRIAQTTSYHR